ncbi:vanillate O-demethylase ferredoxin subunit [Agrobacterium vitis]|nr:vanillate O-demethylase ferredoxin subunit [Agrobacterium vitis]MBE1438199.1 vanillate O-demethylase ferredoxin subunit [Agrobacterium vitis]
MSPIQLTVAKRIEEPGGIVRLTLVDPSGADLPAFEAGAHLDLHLVDDQIDVWRQYSLCSDPQEQSFYEIGVLLDPSSRGGSAAVHRLAQVGAQFEVEGPRNHFPLDETARQSVLLGGGIGVTPMLAMAHRLHRLGRDFVLHFCTRSSDVTAFRTMIADAPWASRVIFHFDDQAPAQRLDLKRDLPAPAQDLHLYVCGPQGFMDWVIAAAETAGHAPSHIHREYFSADIDQSGGGFDVVAKRSGITVHVDAGNTIAKALALAGIKIEVKCEEGVCGTCVTDVLEGVPDHRDVFLTAEEREDGTMICACCSRASSATLVLDI